MGRREESRWWLVTSEDDLAGAGLLHEAGRHNLAAFHAQQAAEKALKGVLVSLGRTHRTHACTELLSLLDEAGEEIPSDLPGAGRRLDLHYVQSRYPNGLGGDPTTYYDAEISAEALELSERFLAFARSRPSRVRAQPHGRVRRVMIRRPDLDRLLDCLEERIGVEALILFGSRAVDDALESSDWDLAVVSDDFEGLSPVQRGLAVVDCRAPGLELVHLTPAELERPDFSYLRCAILEEGQPLADRGVFRRARKRYEKRKRAGEIVFSGGGAEFPESCA